MQIIIKEEHSKNSQDKWAIFQNQLLAARSHFKQVTNLKFHLLQILFLKMKNLKELIVLLELKTNF